MKQLGGWATFCCWMSAAGSALAVLYGFRHFLKPGFGSLTELALIVSCSTILLVLAVMPLQKRLGGFVGGALASIMAACSLFCTVALLARVLMSMVELGGGSDPDSAFWLLLLLPTSLWLLQTGASSRRSMLWEDRLVTLSFVSGGSLLLGIVAAFVPSTVLSLVALGLSASLVVFLVLLASTHGSNREASRFAIAILGPAVLIFGGLNLQARSALAAHEERWKGEVAAERARIAALVFQAPRGEAVDCNSYDGYQAALLETAKLNGALTDLSRASAADPLAPIPEAVRLALAEPSRLIQKFRAATRCRRSDWGLVYEVDAQPSLAPLRILANLTLVEGHKDAQAGDLKSAEEHYADVLRFGAEIESQGGSLVFALTGVSIRESALRALGALVAGPPADPAVLSATAADLGRFAPPSLGPAFAGDRLLAFPWLRYGVFRAPSEGTMSVLNRLIGRVLATKALNVEGFLGEMGDAVADPDFAKASTRIADVEARVQSAWPRGAMAVFVPSGLRIRNMIDRVKARAALVQAALAVEAARGKATLYPAEVQGLPTDPFGAGSPVRYRPLEGGGYQVWSVGTERKDHGGNGAWFENDDSKDIVLSRKH